MSIDTAAVVLLAFVGLYPVVSSGFWIAGGVVFRLADEHIDPLPAGGRPARGHDPDPGLTTRSG